MRIITVYVSMPYRAPSAEGVAANIKAATDVGRTIMRAHPDVMAVVPHQMTKVDPGDRDDAFWLAATLAIQRPCDVVYFGPGWTKSVGCIGEAEDAMITGQRHCCTMERLAQILKEVRG